MSVFFQHITTSLCLFPNLVSCWRPSKHTRTYLAVSYFCVFSWFIFRPSPSSLTSDTPSLLPVFRPSFQSYSSQPSHCILYERHSSFLLCFTYSRLSVLLQGHSFALKKGNSPHNTEESFYRKMFSWGFIGNLLMVPFKALTPLVCTYVSAKVLGLDRRCKSSYNPVGAGSDR